MGHAIISLFIVNKANWFALLTMVCHKSCKLFCVSGCHSSESHNEQHEGVVNASLNVLSE